MPKKTTRALGDLRGIGPAMVKDFTILGIGSVAELAKQNGTKLYERLNQISGTRQDPCVLDTFRCAVAQARNPRLPEEQKDWWYWSRLRKAQQTRSKTKVT